MYRLLVVIGLTAGLAGMAFADGLLVSARNDAPPKTKTITRGRGCVTISYPAAEGETDAMVIGLIQVNYLDAAYLAQLLGGTSIQLTPQARPMQQLGGGMPGFNSPTPYGQYPAQLPTGAGQQAPWGGGYQGAPANGAPRQGAVAGPLMQGGLNPNAPLYPFVPDGIQDIVGIGG